MPPAVSRPQMRRSLSSVLALATEQWAVGLLGWCSRQSPLRLEKNALDGLYRRFRFVLALIQFGARHLARSSRRVHRSPARNTPYRCESCSQSRMVGYRWGKRESEAFSVLMLQPWRTHNDPMLC